MSNLNSSDDRIGYQEKHYTVIFCRKRTNEGNFVLLGMKKRGFGEGKWDGFGGVVEENESYEEAAARALHEETSMECSPENLSSLGYLEFRFDVLQKLMKVHVYETYEFKGVPAESDDVRPIWHDEKAVPLRDMWPDNTYWLPLVLENKKIVGRFDYEDDETISNYSITVEK